MNNKNEEYKNLLSYATLLNDRSNFRKSGTKHGSEFNKFETPINTYFKILFYFRNGNSSSYSKTIDNGGFLAPTWLEYESNNVTPYYDHNSAWAYLKLNGEEERAEKLEKFITLLSNISTESPWFFSSISGLDQALERNAGQNKEFKIEEEHKKISIKCLPDAFDTRIGTLLDLYRDIVWSWQTKREVVPSNLRKFDMGIFIFSDPIKNIHNPEYDKEKEASMGLIEEAHIKSNKSSYITSYKYLEFHNCEFDYNSSKSSYGELNNTEGNSPEYTIDIYYDDVYEQRYNEFMMRTIGDLSGYDFISSAKSKRQQDSEFYKNELSTRVDLYQLNGFIANALNELIGAGKSIVENKIKSIALGNLYTLSPMTLSSQIKGATKGHVLSTVSQLDDYMEHVNGKKVKKAKDLGNLFKGSSAVKNI